MIRSQLLAAGLACQLPVGVAAPPTCPPAPGMQPLTGLRNHRRIVTFFRWLWGWWPEWVGQVRAVAGFLS